MQRQASDQDTGLILRGLVLLAVMAVIVGGVLFILFRGGAAPAPAVERPDGFLAASTIAVPGTTFPASVAWAPLLEVGAELPSPPGMEVRYTALTTLARLGSDKVPWPAYREMLDEQRQLRNFRTTLQDGRTVANETDAHQVVIYALTALADWHREQRAQQRSTAPEDLRVYIYPMVAKLAESPVLDVRVQAEKTRGMLFE